MSTDQSKLGAAAAAAEALVQAALTGSDAESVALGMEFVSSVKRLTDGSIKDPLDGDIKTSHQQLFQQLSKLADTLMSFKTAIDLQTSTIKEQTRLQAVAQALKEENYLSHNRCYYNKGESRCNDYSDDLIKAFYGTFAKIMGSTLQVYILEVNTLTTRRTMPAFKQRYATSCMTYLESAPDLQLLMARLAFGMKNT